MFSDDDAGRIARAFGLGDGPAFTGTVARGEQGEVAQLETSRGLWAVKTSFRPPELDGEDGAFQAAAVAAGVPAPAVVFTGEESCSPTSAISRCVCSDGWTCCPQTAALTRAGWGG